MTGSKLDWRLVPGPVASCCRSLWEAGYQACPVGGCVRDLLLGRSPGDWDAATSALPQEVQALFPHTIPTGLQHGTVTVLLEDMAVEVTTFRGETGYSDGRHPDAVVLGWVWKLTWPGGTSPSTPWPWLRMARSLTGLAGSLT